MLICANDYSIVRDTMKALTGISSLTWVRFDSGRFASKKGTF